MGTDETPESTAKQIADLQKEVARLKEQMDEINPSCSFEGMNKDELRDMIAHLRPDREMYAGKKFLLALLDSRGVTGVDVFTNKALKALSVGDGLDLPHHFDEVEKEIFKKAALRMWNRKEFLTTMAWSIPGVVLAIKTPLDITVLATEKSSLDADTPSSDSKLNKAHHIVKNISLLSDIPLAAALVYEGVRHDREMRLEHIADAVSELSDRITEEQKHQKNSR
jgi:hypothetical protein